MSLTTLAVITMTITAYTDCDPGMRCDGIMASGIKTFDGAAACGPAWPFWTVLFVPALPKSLVCLDRGSAITDHHLDIWMKDRHQALAFGVRQATVWVLPHTKEKRPTSFNANRFLDKEVVTFLTSARPARAHTLDKVAR